MIDDSIEVFECKLDDLGNAQVQRFGNARYEILARQGKILVLEVEFAGSDRLDQFAGFDKPRERLLGDAQQLALSLQMSDVGRHAIDCFVPMPFPDRQPDQEPAALESFDVARLVT